MKSKKIIIMGVLALSLFGVNAFAANTSDSYVQFTGGNRDLYSYSEERPKFDTSPVYVKQNRTVGYLMGGGEVGLMPGDGVEVSVVPGDGGPFWTKTAQFTRDTNGQVSRISTTACEVNGVGHTVRLKSKSLQYQPNYTYYIVGVWSPDSVR